MAPRPASPTLLLLLFSGTVFLASMSILMLGPLLVSLAHEFHTSVALMGQLAAATAITWGITAPLAGPVSDAYGQRRMLLIGLMLMALGMLVLTIATYDPRSLQPDARSRRVRRERPNPGSSRQRHGSNQE